jgi:dienelactone hydrolase
MIRTFCLRLILMLVFAEIGVVASQGQVALAPSASMNERVLMLPGDSARPVELVVTVLSPSGQGPFPLVIMNHGAAGSKSPAQMERYHNTFSAYYFLSRGYAVVLPMMRGYAGSGGAIDLHKCDLKAIGLENAKDIRAVMDRISAEPGIDASRVVVAGQSAGGWNTLALGSLNLPRVKGLISFAGGISSAQCPDWETTLPADAAYFGARTKVPSIWFYGDNDKLFAPPLWRAMYKRYSAAGGRAELVAYGEFMTDSHQMLSFPEGMAIWAPKVDAFLAGLNMPHAITHPEYLPADFPAPSHFAEVDDIKAVPGLSEESRKTYRLFLNSPSPKIFMLSPSGFSGFFQGGFDPVGRAFAACRKRYQDCQVYAADEYVSWMPLPAASAVPSSH